MEDSGFALCSIPVDDDIKLCMWKAIQHFKNNKLETKQVGRKNDIICYQRSE